MGFEFRLLWMHMCFIGADCHFQCFLTSGRVSLNFKISVLKLNTYYAAL